MQLTRFDSEVFDQSVSSPMKKVRLFKCQKPYRNVGSRDELGV